jgi:hypothetical protein
VWAHVRPRAAKHLAKGNNQVSYIQDNGAVLKHNELKNIAFAEPFSYIENLEHDKARDKLRYLILFFFLEHGHSNSIGFTTRGFDTFRIAITDITKARAQAKMSPQQPSSTTDIRRHSPTRATGSDAIKQAQAPAKKAASNSAATTEITKTTTSSLRRENKVQKAKA